MHLTLWLVYINRRLYRLKRPNGDFQLSWNEIITVFLTVLLINETKFDIKYSNIFINLFNF